MNKIKSVKESKHFKLMAKELKRLNGGKLTISLYNEMINK